MIDSGADTVTVLGGAERDLAAAGISNARAEAGWLLAAVLRVTGAALLTRPELTVAQHQRFHELVRRRCAREPLQHLLGRAAFRYLDLQVGPGVFVPRPETELLVDLVLQKLADVPSPVIVDLCSGSGAIGLALASELPHARVTLVERSDAALGWLRRNVAEQPPAVRERVDIIQADIALADIALADSTQADSTQADSTQADSTHADRTHADSTQADSTHADRTHADSRQADSTQADSTQANSMQADTAVLPERSALSQLDGTVHAVVANPPYVPTTAQVGPEVAHDPPDAVFGGSEGLDLFPALSRLGRRLLRAGGLLALEHDETHSSQLTRLLRADGWLDVTDVTDLTGRSRFVTGRRHQRHGRHEHAEPA